MVEPFDLQLGARGDLLRDASDHLPLGVLDRQHGQVDRLPADLLVALEVVETHDLHGRTLGLHLDVALHRQAQLAAVLALDVDQRGAALAVGHHTVTTRVRTDQTREADHAAGEHDARALEQRLGHDARLERLRDVLRRDREDGLLLLVVAVADQHAAVLVEARGLDRILTDLQLPPRATLGVHTVRVVLARDQVALGHTLGLGLLETTLRQLGRQLDRDLLALVRRDAGGEQDHRTSGLLVETEQRVARLVLGLHRHLGAEALGLVGLFEVEHHQMQLGLTDRGAATQTVELDSADVSQRTSTHRLTHGAKTAGLDLVGTILSHVTLLNCFVHFTISHLTQHVHGSNFAKTDRNST